MVTPPFARVSNGRTGAVSGAASQDNNDKGADATMSSSLPAWFPADRIYRARNGWHIGSSSGVSVGPYADESVARTASLRIQSALKRARNPTAQADVVRHFLRQQTPVNVRDQPTAPAISVRVGESSKFWARSSRYFTVDNVWFFQTREGVDVGPYCSKETMARDASRLSEILGAMQDSGDAARRMAIYEFMRRPMIA